MPLLQPEVQYLAETEEKAGDYVLIWKMDCIRGSVWKAKDLEGKEVAAKITEKTDIFTLSQVEYIYREYHFLARLTKHPNIAAAYDCFHGIKNIYLVMEYAGRQNGC